MKRPPPDDLFFEPKKKPKPVPHAFVLDALAPLDPTTRPMFGCTAVYVEEKIVVILRDKPDDTDVNGVWLATTHEHHQSLRRELPSLRSVRVLGSGVTGWQMLPADEVGFEDEVLRAARLILAGDPRIGKVPAARRPRGAAKTKTPPKKTPPKKKAPARRASRGPLR
jgi:hypothetical protein